MPVFASFVTLSGRILRGNGKRPEWVNNLLSDNMTRGQSYNSSVQADAIPAPTYTVSSGSLPPGLSLNASTGQLSGTPSTGGNYSFTIKATNPLGEVEQSFSKVVVLPTPANVEFIVVGGGGGGGFNHNPHYWERYKPWRSPPNQGSYGTGGGAHGGGGGYISSVTGESSGRNTSPVSKLSPVQGTNYYVSIGGGGSGVSSGVSNGGRGGNTVFSSNTAQGGGGGGYGCCSGGSNAGSGGSGGGGGGTPNWDVTCSGSGSCGGGAGGSGTANQGYNGTGYYAGGAGSAGSASGNGAGITSSITGSAVSYSNGGGGSDYGDGGGVGGTARPGVVIISYDGADPTIDPGLTYVGPTTVGSNQVIRFTSGSGNIQW